MTIPDDLAIIWPTFHNDGPSMLESLGAVGDLGFPMDHCAVAVSTGKELNEQAAARVMESGAEIIPSRYYRSLSIACARELLDLVSTHGERRGTSYVFQLDSDTLLLSTDSIVAAMQAGAAAMCWAWPGQRFAGCGWLIRTDVCRTLVQAIDDNHPAMHGCPGRIGSDVLTSHLLDRLYPPEAVIRHWHRPDGGYGRAWPYTEDADPIDFAGRSEIITFGNRFRIKGCRPCEKRERVALEMHRFRRAIQDRDPSRRPVDRGAEA